MCPRCDEKFEVMDIYKLLNGDKSFCCSHCCPNDNHDECKSTSAYTLVDFHDKRGLDSVTALVEQLNEQLGKSTNSWVLYSCCGNTLSDYTNDVRVLTTTSLASSAFISVVLISSVLLF